MQKRGWKKKTESGENIGEDRERNKMRDKRSGVRRGVLRRKEVKGTQIGHCRKVSISQITINIKESKDLLDKTLDSVLGMKCRDSFTPLCVCIF